MIRLPVIDANDQLLEAELDGQVFFLRLSWNSEGEFWSLGLSDFERTVVLSGIRIVPDVNLLAMWRHLPIPRGELYALLMDETRGDFVRGDFLDGIGALIYVEQDEDVTL